MGASIYRWNLVQDFVPLVFTPLGVYSKALTPLSFLCKLMVAPTPKKWCRCQVEQMPSGSDKSFNPAPINCGVIRSSKPLKNSLDMPKVTLNSLGRMSNGFNLSFKIRRGSSAGSIDTSSISTSHRKSRWFSLFC